jgi:hypothetical protein
MTAASLIYRILIAGTLVSLVCAGGCDSNDSQNSSGTTEASPNADQPDQTDPPAPYTKPITKSLIADLLKRGDGLYDEVSLLPDETPSSSLGAAQLVNGDQGPIGAFYAKDRAYQADLPKANLGTDPADLVAAAGDLAEFETFAYSTAVAVASCNEHDARLNLRVAKAYLDEAHLDFHGTESQDWSPPDISGEVTEASQCSE